MDKYTVSNGIVSFNKVWIMTEAHAIAARTGGTRDAFARGLSSAWFHAKMATYARRSVCEDQARIAELATRGADSLRAMISDMQNIDRYTDADRAEMRSLNSALVAA